MLHRFFSRRGSMLVATCTIYHTYTYRVLGIWLGLGFGLVVLTL